MLVNQVARVIAAGAVMLSAGTLTLPASAATHRSHHQIHHHSRPTRSGIPQHNGGDRDADNNGGPSDGDGNA
jgi:hypothetical protein